MSRGFVVVKVSVGEDKYVGQWRCNVHNGKMESLCLTENLKEAFFFASAEDAERVAGRMTEDAPTGRYEAKRIELRPIVEGRQSETQL